VHGEQSHAAPDAGYNRILLLVGHERRARRPLLDHPFRNESQRIRPGIAGDHEQVGLFQRRRGHKLAGLGEEESPAGGTEDCAPVGFLRYSVMPVVPDQEEYTSLPRRFRSGENVFR